MAAGKVIQAVLRLQDNMSGGILKAARNAKKAGADINNDMMQATQLQPLPLADSLRWII